jgi:uncharacterized protein with GYD domain
LANYVVLIKYTEQGLKTFKDLPRRLQRVEEAFQKAGGKMTGWYLTMGQYDSVVTAELPDDEVAARVLLSLAALGNAQSTTLKAFTRQEAEAIARQL